MYRCTYWFPPSILVKVYWANLFVSLAATHWPTTLKHYSAIWRLALKPF